MRPMSETKSQPQFSSKGLSEAERRRQRQAEALRTNLARRKTQARERADEPATAAPSQDGTTTPSQDDTDVQR